MKNICRKISYNGLVLTKRFHSLLTKEIYISPFQRFRCTMPATTFDAEKEKADLFEALPRIIEDIAKHPKFEELPVTRQWMEKVIIGTATGGKAARGLTTVMAYKTVEKPEKITAETVRLAQALGWCTELAYCVVLDDIADGSMTRRGKPCWYRREDVGLAHAVNDACLVKYCLNKVLQDNFERSHIYIPLCHIFNETLFYTSIGQFLDIRGSEFKNNYAVFTTENYEAIVKHKSAYYTYKLPVSVALMLANRFNEENERNCDEISKQLGRLFQIQDDYIDCFGDEFLTGKIGTDIQEGKCTWLAVNALGLCNAKSRAVFSACYGSKEPAHVERIKQLYIQLKLPELYKQKEREMYDNIIDKIETIPAADERGLYRNILDMTYDRKK